MIPVVAVAFAQLAGSKSPRHCQECGRRMRLIYARSSQHRDRDSRTGLPRRRWCFACPEAVDYWSLKQLDQRSWHSVSFPWWVRVSTARKRVEAALHAYDRRHP